MPKYNIAPRTKRPSPRQQNKIIITYNCETFYAFIKVVSVSNPLGTERIGKLMVRFAVPSIIALVLNSLYNMVDQVFIGNGVGYLGNAATNVILPIMTVVLAVGLMIGDGCAAFMGLNMGKGKTDKATHGVGNAIILTVGFGVIFTILCGIFLEPLCWMFGATEQSIEYCLDYGRPISRLYLFGY